MLCLNCSFHWILAVKWIEWLRVLFVMLINKMIEWQVKDSSRLRTTSIDNTNMTAYCILIVLKNKSSNSIIKFEAINCQSINSKKHSFYSFLDTCNQYIISGNETWITPIIYNRERLPAKSDLATFREDRKCLRWCQACDQIKNYQQTW